MLLLFYLALIGLIIIEASAISNSSGYRSRFGYRILGKDDPMAKFRFTEKQSLKQSQFTDTSL